MSISQEIRMPKYWVHLIIIEIVLVLGILFFVGDMLWIHDIGILAGVLVLLVAGDYLAHKITRLD